MTNLLWNIVEIEEEEEEEEHYEEENNCWDYLCSTKAREKITFFAWH